MNGVYGDILIAFPEQFRHVTVYRMDAQVNGGFTKTVGSDKRIRCLFQHTKGRTLKDSNGNLVKTSGFELWTHEKALAGYFVNIDDDVYRITFGADWTYEGGFVRYALDRVVGNDGTDTENTTWNLGKGSFG